MEGILNIYKEKGFTSHDVVAIVRGALKTKKVGHTGTLDPDAEGVLPVCVGRATKLADIIMDGKKSYRAVLRLGITTTTQDASGEVQEERDVVFDEDKIREAIVSFIGEIEQIPPMYSAIKVNGRKLYELAREGKEIARKTRTIQIYDIRIREFLPPNRVEFDVDCSKGTYIRTLCADIGEKLGCGGHMESLLRTATGAFLVEDAITIGQLRELAAEGNAQQVMLSLKDALVDYPKVCVLPEAQKLLYNGGKIKKRYWVAAEELPEGTVVQAWDAEDALVGLYTIKKEDDLYIKPFKMLI